MNTIARKQRQKPNLAGGRNDVHSADDDSDDN